MKETDELIVRLLFAWLEIITGGGVGLSMLETRKNAMTAGDFCESKFVKMDVVSAVVYTIGTSVDMHKITSKGLYKE